jgi:nanoRNase/pAp phosphatase (c-di-AMP/oligoRNAs hydrolase)
MTKRRSDRFLEALAEFERALVVTHDNPDPDALASGWALGTLVTQRLGRPARLVAGGAIVRAENTRMVELLKPPIELVEGVEIEEDSAVVFVDCAPTSTNHLLSELDLRPVAVIDHHQHVGPRYRARFRDVRTNVAASATIATQYLREQGIEPTGELATALLYAIHTDALGWPAFTRTDQRMISWLSPLANLNRLADIQSAPLDRAYYADLLLAMENTFVYDGSALCFLPQANGPEIVGEVADLLIRAADLRRVLCGAVVGGDVLVSVRTTADGGDASELVHRVLGGLGHGGGHRNRAGGKVSAPARSPRLGEELQGELRNRWLKACRVDQQRGTRLVARKEILQHL